MKTLLSILAATLLFVGCSPRTSSMTISQPQPVIEPAKVDEPTIPQSVAPAAQKVPDQKFDYVELDGGGRQLEAKPQVDILFVVDNSDSMRSAQANLVANVHKFAEQIGRTKMIDYHIGVISVWDYSKRFNEKRTDGYGIGDLRFVKDSTGATRPQRFVTRNESSLLASTLSIGVQAYKDGGPEVEEFFAPLAAALDKTGRGAPNEGFFRPEAQLVVIFMTDADEQKEDVDPESGTRRLSPREMYEKLVSFKGDDRSKVSAYGVLVPANAPDTFKDYGLRITPKDHPECFDMTGKTPKLNGTCPAKFGPDRLEEFVMLANGAGTAAEIRRTYIKNITAKDFSADLVEIGSGISRKTLAKVIPLSGLRPRVVNGQLQILVRYGTPDELAAGKGQIIPYGRAGWTYDVDQNAVVLSGDIRYADKVDGRYSVKLVVAPRD